VNARSVGLVVSGALLVSAGRLPAQDSQLGVNAPGTPVRQESVRARGTGGAFALFDALSPLGEAALADLPRGVFAAQTQITRRQVEYADGDAYTLKDSRFPVLVAAGRTPWRFSAATGFATFIERSYVVTQRDSALLRGTYQPYTDEHKSDGNVADLRLAIAGRPTPRVAIGGAVHLLTGSTQEEVRRRWDDSLTYRNTFELENVEYTGFGVSLSTLITVTPRVRVAGWFRSDGTLHTKARGETVDETALPTQYGAAVEWRPRGILRVAASVRYTGWSVAPGGHDALGLAVGAEAGSATFPVRLGVRRDQLAFGPGPDAPTEFGVSAGLARRFGQGRARFEFALERLWRSAAGLDERLWILHVGLVVQP